MDDTSNVQFRTVVVSIQSADAVRIAAPAEKLKALGVDIVTYAINSDDADDDVLVYQDLVRETKQADFVFIRCMSDLFRFKRFDKYEPILRECKAHVLIFSGNADITLMYRDVFRGSDELYRKITRYPSYRGPENDYGMFHCMAYHLGFTEVPPPEPMENQRDGYYHKGMDRDTVN